MAAVAAPPEYAADFAGVPCGAADGGDDSATVALLAQVEALAEDTAKRMARGAHAEAVHVLLRAWDSTAGDSAAPTASQSWSPAARGARPVASPDVSAGVHLARASVCLLLVAALSGDGAHAEALSSARCAEVETRQVWRALLGVRPGVSDAASSLQRLLQWPTVPWLARAAEVTAQAKHLHAIQLELAAHSPVEAEVEQLQLEGALIAEHLLAEDHPVRRRAAAALREWRSRSWSFGASAAPAFRSSAHPMDGAGGNGGEGETATVAEIAAMLLGDEALVCDERPVSRAPIRANLEPLRLGREPLRRSASDGFGGSSRLQRLYLGTSAPLDMEAERRRARLRGRILSENPLAPSMLMTSSASAPSSMGPSRLHTAGTQLSREWSPTSAGGSGVWNSRSAPPGELYEASGHWGPDGLPRGDNWRSTRRSLDGSCTMLGGGGKSSWALRSSVGASSKKGKKLNIWEDWKINSGGDAKPLKQRVMESFNGQMDFAKKMKSESLQFKQVYLKHDGPSPEDLAEDRILYCSEGLALKRRQRSEAIQQRRQEAARAALEALAMQPSETESVGEVSPAVACHGEMPMSPVITCRSGVSAPSSEAKPGSAPSPQRTASPATRKRGPQARAGLLDLREKLLASQDCVLDTLAKKEAAGVRRDLQVGGGAGLKSPPKVKQHGWGDM